MGTTDYWVLLMHKRGVEDLTTLVLVGLRRDLRGELLLLGSFVFFLVLKAL